MQALKQEMEALKRENETLKTEYDTLSAYVSSGRELLASETSQQ
jgi:hypothetical protein